MQRRAAMLIARGQRRIGPLDFRSHVALERDFLIHSVERSQGTLDMSFIRGASRAVDAQMLYVVLDGAIDWRDGDSVTRFEAPVAFSLRWSDFDGGLGRQGPSMRTSGAPFHAIEIRLATPSSASGPELAHLGERAWSALREYADATWSDPMTSETSARAGRLVTELSRAGIAGFSPAMSIHDEDEGHLRTWKTVAQLYETLDLQPNRKSAAFLSGLSLRHLSRLLVAMQRDYPVIRLGWRELLLDARLRMAALLLSIPSLSIAEVADAIGYRHAQAMANAFQRTTMPAAGVLRARLTFAPPSEREASRWRFGEAQKSTFKPTCSQRGALGRAP